MKRLIGMLVGSLFFAVPMVVAQESGHADHAEVGIFAEYFRFSDPGPTSNYIGLGGRAAFNLNSSAQIEAEMGYDFERNYTTTFSNGVTTANVQSRLRGLHGLFGPKFQTNTGPVRAFVVLKGGFLNFGVPGGSTTSGFTSQINSFTSGDTNGVFYPGGGVEFFAGPIGLRVEAGDMMYFDRGANHNLRLTFGPTFRF